ncbi:MAG: DUF86 domain-containing protein [Bacteroidales bacterium]
MSKRSDILLLDDIVEACGKIEKFVKGLDYNEFLVDDKTTDAVIRNFEIIGEAANRLSDSIFTEFENLNWKQIIGLRNRLIHGYFGVDYQILWNIINENLSTFKQQIEGIKKNLEFRK